MKNMKEKKYELNSLLLISTNLADEIEKINGQNIS